MPRVSIRDLGQLSYIHGITHWAYKAGDHTAADLLNAGYWDDVRTISGGRKVVCEGDWIFVSGRHYALQLYVLQSDRQVVVGVMTALADVGELPAPDRPDQDPPPGTTMDIMRTLRCSAFHIPPAIQEECVDIDGFLGGEDDETFTVSCRPWLDGNAPADAPQELTAVMRFAVSLKCDRVLFDNDGPELRGFPLFDAVDD
jgi:hypothetical protein